MESIGLLLDRAADPQVRISVCWSLGENTVATTGDAVFPYLNCLSALEVHFPAAGERFGVERLAMHPQFRQRFGTLTMERARDDYVFYSGISKHNCAVLFLKGGQEVLSGEQRKELNASLNFRAETKDGIAGNLSEIDLALVLQTLTTAKKQGELTIVDGRNRPIAQLFCEDGRVVFARHRHLQNEMAIHQIAAKKLTGGFHFRAIKRPSFATKARLTKPTDMLLLESYRRVDELDKLRNSLGGDEQIFVRKSSAKDVQNLPSGIRDEPFAVWCVADGLTPNGKLWELLHMDDYNIYTALNLLKEMDLIAPLSPAGSSTVLSMSNAPQSIKVLEIVPQLPLAAGNDLTSLSIDTTGNYGQKSGILMGAIDAYDPWHLIHNLPLLVEATGTPVFKDGKVVAMHTGVLPSSPEVSLVALQQCLWVDSVLQCLTAAGGSQSVKRITQAGEEMVASSLPTGSEILDRASGCSEVATIKCPRCQSTSYDSARFCRNCKFEFIPLPEADSSEQKSTLLLASALASVAVLLGLMLFICFTPQANLARLPIAYLPARPTITAYIEQANLKLGKWESALPNQIFKNGDTVRVVVAVKRDCFLYLLHQSDSGAPELIFPQSERLSQIKQNGDAITFPEKTEELRGSRRYLLGLTCRGEPGTDTIVCLASQRPLSGLNAGQNVQKAYQVASDVSNWAAYPNGFELSEHDLIDASGDVKVPASDNAVFVSKLMIAHTN